MDTLYVWVGGGEGCQGRRGGSNGDTLHPFRAAGTRQGVSCSQSGGHRARPGLQVKRLLITTRKSRII